MKIAITGKMCSGKSTIANMIQQLDNEYDTYSYGQKIKDIAVELFNMKNKDRSLLINIASKLREIDGDVWSKYIIKKTKYKNKCIIDDLRFQNELDMLDDSWKIIKLNINYEDQKERIKKLYPDNYEDHYRNMGHDSEKSQLDLSDKDIILDINTSEESYEQIKHKLYLLMTKSN
jgi:cytidylate kinase|tara:strand:- start:910 stop:1434 length:525 start_codon:yes stop_codon:yes gene_type:complete